MEQQNTLASGTAHAALSREELEQCVRTRAWRDDAFRQEFLAHPKAVLERDYAQCFPEGKIPSELSIKLVEEEEQVRYFVLPPKAADDHSEIDEVDEQDLFDVSGGTRIGLKPEEMYLLPRRLIADSKNWVSENPNKRRKISS